MVHEEAAAFALDALDHDEARSLRATIAGLPGLRGRTRAAPLGRGRARVCGRAAGAEPVAASARPRHRRAVDAAAPQTAPQVAGGGGGRRRRAQCWLPPLGPRETGDPQAGFRRYAAKGANATLLVSQSGEAVLAARRLPPLASGTVYELWVIAGGRARPAGLFRGSLATLTRPVPRGATVAVSVEPAGGSSRPTGPAVLRAERT